MAWMGWRQPQVYRPDVELGALPDRRWRRCPRCRCSPAGCRACASACGARSIDLAKALARIQELATRDELTGLINRRHMLELLEQERQRCVRSGRHVLRRADRRRPLQAANDAAGHAAGDEVLRAFARESLNVIRLADVLARWGGDEFVLLLTDTSAPARPRRRLERLRQRAASLRSATPTAPSCASPCRPASPSTSPARACRRRWSAPTAPSTRPRRQGRDRVVVA